MDLSGIITDLKQQRAQIDAALAALEGVSGEARNNNISTSNGGGRKKRTMSASARKAIAEAQRRRWAKWKKAQRAA
jgi:hypothetical protein